MVDKPRGPLPRNIEGIAPFPRPLFASLRMLANCLLLFRLEITLCIYFRTLVSVHSS
jgi:hypothetical protein